MRIRRSGIIKTLILLSTLGVGTRSTAASAVTGPEVTAACGRCHGLTVNGVAVATGPGLLGFTSKINGRSQAMWASTIMRMISSGAAVADVNGTAAYLAGLGVSAPAPTATPTATPIQVSTVPTAPVTARPTRRPWPPHRPWWSNPGLHERTPSSEQARTPTPTASPSPTATAAAVSSGDPGAIAYDAHCAFCHEPGAPGFVGRTVYGTSAGDIAEAMAEVRQMQFLRTLLDSSTIQNIARYLRPTGQSSHNGEGEHNDRGDD